MADTLGREYTHLGRIKQGLKRVKILSPDQLNMANKDGLRQTARHSEMGQMIVNTYPDMSWENFDAEKFVHLRAAFINYLNNRTTEELYTEIEIENLLKFAKKITLLRIQRNLAVDKDVDEYDREYLLKLCDKLIDLHKLKHGEKKIIAKMDFSYIRDL